MTNTERTEYTIPAMIRGGLLRLALVLALALGLAALTGTTADAQQAAPAPTASAHEPIPGADDVVAVDYEEVSEAMWQNLLDLGYTGVAGDGAERLYVPRDVAVDSCYTDTDCALVWNAPATWYERDNVEERAALGGCENVGLVTNEDLSCTRP